MIPLPWRLAPLVAAEWRHQPVRHAMAVIAVALGVALAFSVHLINASALSEFSQAVRTVNGEPDLTLSGTADGVDDTLLDAAAARDEVQAASPVLEVPTHARLDSTAASGPAPRVPLQVLGIDALRVGALAPALMPRPAAGAGRLAMLDPTSVFLNPAAMDRLALREGQRLALQAGPRWVEFVVGGRVAAGGAPLAVMDLAAAQQAFGAAGRITRVDLRLRAGTGVAAQDALLAALRADPRFGPTLVAQRPDDAGQRISNLSRAYRVNLTVLALVALFVGAFLVYSVVSLSVAQRTPAFALLGVLGLSAAQRRALVLGECAVLGAVGAALGLALGTGLAALALRWISGDLGGGYFPGVRPALQWSWGAAAVFGALGVACAVVGGWWPARTAQRLAPAQALKGLGALHADAPPAWPGLALLAAGGLLALAPPIAGLPLAAYAAVAALLLGGVALVPAGVALALPPPRTQPATGAPLWRLARERARFHRGTAVAAVAGVVTSLALCVALTVMVASFREGVSTWLARVLPADLYARSAASSGTAQQAWFDDTVPARIAALPGVAAVQASRSVPMLLSPTRPTVTLVARPLADPARALPLVGEVTPRPDGEVGVFVSEAMVALYDARPGTRLTLPLAGRAQPVFVQGVWRDYARQFGAVAMDLADWQRLSGDRRLNELAITLRDGAQVADVQAAVTAAMPDPSLLEFASAGELKRLSLRIFDRSFAVTRYLQAVAIAIGWIGIAASLSAQVLARRKEFGLLAHLGLTRRQIGALVVGECALWLAAGVVLGLALGALVSAVLVHVVNPQSFHWRMDMVWPAGPIAALAATVFAAGLLASAFSAQHAASRQAVLAVKEDW